jgi:hypothetical protein
MEIRVHAVLSKRVDSISDQRSVARVLSMGKVLEVKALPWTLPTHECTRYMYYRDKSAKLDGLV